MNMETLRFKTNIKCAGCVAKVTSQLDEYAVENAREVDFTSHEKENAHSSCLHSIDISHTGK